MLSILHALRDLRRASNTIQSLAGWYWASHQMISDESAEDIIRCVDIIRKQADTIEKRVLKNGKSKSQNNRKSGCR